VCVCDPAQVGPDDVMRFSVDFNLSRNSMVRALGQTGAKAVAGVTDFSFVKKASAVGLAGGLVSVTAWGLSRGGIQGGGNDKISKTLSPTPSPSPSPALFGDRPSPSPAPSSTLFGNGEGTSKLADPYTCTGVDALLCTKGTFCFCSFCRSLSLRRPGIPGII
jgi:hypothetical protein